jgi:hypothetical protein
MLLIASLVTLVFNLPALILTDLAIMSNFAGDSSALDSVRRLRTFVVVGGIVSMVIFPFWPFITVISLVMVGVKNSKYPHVRASLVLPIVFTVIAFVIGAGALTLMVTGSFAAERDEEYVPLPLLGFVMWAIGMYAPVFFSDRLVCKLIDAEEAVAPSNSGGGGGARIIQPGVAVDSKTRAACPSCQAPLEYNRNPGGEPTQVQCYKCQAIVEFD